MDPEHRRQLARLALKKRTRRVPDDLPCRWKPWTVVNPEDQQPFSDSAAWEFIAQRLEDLEQEIKEIVLEKPAGKPGFVMECAVASRVIYIKFHSEHGRTILGRSFHYSGE
jgi:hypothetical protein